MLLLTSIVEVIGLLYELIHGCFEPWYVNEEFYSWEFRKWLAFEIWIAPEHALWMSDFFKSQLLILSRNFFFSSHLWKMRRKPEIWKKNSAYRGPGQIIFSAQSNDASQN